MKTLGICGHFAGGEKTSSGQIIKTRILYEELLDQLGKAEIIAVDSQGGIKAVPRMVFQSFDMFRQCRNIVMLPAYKGLRVFTPLYGFYNIFFHRNLHYVVIGGWLDEFLKQHRWLKSMLKKYKGIYVETASMKDKLERNGFTNIIVMPNFKRIPINNDVLIDENEPYKLCTFSRVMKEKGIEDAIEAVKAVNEANGRTVFCLDIYGEVDANYQDRFNEMKQSFPDYIKYAGLVPFDKSVDTIKHYFALLFPTFYSGEGFAGTLIDAMASGVPVIASDWHYNSEIVIPGKTGALIQNCNSERITDQLNRIKENPAEWVAMRETTLLEAKKYAPEVAVQCLLERM